MSNELAERIAFSRGLVEWRRELNFHEGEIVKSLQQMAMSLKDIEKKELWKYVDGEEFSSMDEYCQKRWGFGKRRRQQIVQADNVRMILADVVTEPNAKLLLENVKEGQMRAIMEVPVYQRPAVIEAVALETTQPKGSDIRKKAREMGVRVASDLRKAKPKEKTVCPLCHGTF